MTEGWALTSI